VALGPPGTALAGAWWAARHPGAGQARPPSCHPGGGPGVGRRAGSPAVSACRLPASGARKARRSNISRTP